MSDTKCPTPTPTRGMSDRLSENYAIMSDKQRTKMRITVRLSTDLLQLLRNIKGKTLSDKIRTAIKLATLYQEEEDL